MDATSPVVEWTVGQSRDAGSDNFPTFRRKLVALGLLSEEAATPSASADGSHHGTRYRYPYRGPRSSPATGYGRAL
jgi:hypothetical protein